MTRVTPEHTDARVRAIQDAAFTVFARRGSEKATMADIAREAGLSPGTLYLYYTSKADLLRDVCIHKAADVQFVFETATVDGGTPLEMLRRVGQEYARIFSEEGHDKHVIVSLEATIAGAREPDAFGAQLRDGAYALTSMLQGLVERAQETGELDPQVDARTLALVLHAVGLGMRELLLTMQGDVDIHSAFSVLIDMVSRMTPEDATTRDALVERSGHEGSGS